MNELKYYISAIYYSLFSRRFYADLIANKKILGTKYLLIVSLIVATPLAFEIKYIISQVFPSTRSETIEDNLNYIKDQIPNLSVENNRLKIASEANKNIVTRSGELLAVFDSENKIDNLDSYNNVLVVGQDSVRLKLSEDKGTAVIMTNEVLQALRQYFIEEGSGRKFDKERFFQDMLQVSNTPLVLIIVFSSFWYFIKYLFSALAYSFVAGIMLTIICKKTEFDFRQCFRIVAFTATPVALLESLSNMLGGGLFSFASLVYFITHIVYIHFAIESYKKLSLGK